MLNIFAGFSKINLIIIVVVSIIVYLIMACLGLMGIKGIYFFRAVIAIICLYGMVLFSIKSFAINEYSIFKYGVKSSNLKPEIKLNDAVHLRLVNNFHKELLWFPVRVFLLIILNAPALWLNNVLLGLTKH